MKKRVINIISCLVGMAVGAIIVKKMMEKNIDKWKKQSDKHLTMFHLMNQWIKTKQEGKSIVNYLESNNYKNIAIYGMSFIGETLVEELKNTNICVKYGIDKRAYGIASDIDVITLEEELGDVDVIVVTAITFFEEIAEELEKKVDCPIISLEDILYEIS